MSKRKRPIICYGTCDQCKAGGFLSEMKGKRCRKIKLCCQKCCDRQEAVEKQGQQTRGG